MALNTLKCFRFIKPVHSCYVYEFNYQHGIFFTQTRNYSAVLTEEYKRFQKIVGSWDTSIKKERTNRAMKAYLERSKQHDEFMRKQQISYQIGKRHLANMMGEDPETFTQANVDEAIRYLFPSGIYDKAARPMMKPPSVLFPAKKEAEFDESGRPHHFLFYTGRPNYFKVLFDLNTHIMEIKKHYNNLLIMKSPIDPKSKIEIVNKTWVSKDVLEKMLIETIKDKEYDTFKTAMERLVNMPYSIRAKSFVEPYLVSLINKQTDLKIQVPKIGEDGRAYVTINECKRKAARGRVTIRSPGTGQISINGKDITYFEDKQERNQTDYGSI